jgi:hypothetical protein
MSLQLCYAGWHLKLPAPSSFANFYTHLGSACDLAEDFLLSAYLLLLHCRGKQSPILFEVICDPTRYRFGRHPRIDARIKCVFDHPQFGGPFACGARMTTETTEWSLGTLKIYLELAISDLDAKLSERKEAQDGALAIAWQAAKEALSEVKAQADAGFIKNNEWRGSINDVITTRIARTEVDQMVRSLSEKILSAVSRLDRIEARAGGISTAWAAAMSVTAILISLAGILAGVLLHLIH